MITFPQSIIKELKKPLGKVQQDYSEIKKLSRSHRIISVGDVCTLDLLDTGIRPHLAVFDYRFMRKDLEAEKIERLRKEFPVQKSYENPAGTLSEALLNDAAELIEKGGAVHIKGEEDLTALAFMLAAKENDLVIYGQPEKGVVLVKPDKILKSRIKELLTAASAAFAHVVE